MKTDRTRYGSLAAIVLVTIALVAGCGSSDSGTPAKADAPKSTATTKSAPTKAASAAPCDLVSDDVAAAVLGVTIVRREAHGVAGSGTMSCLKGLKRTNDPKGFSYVSAAEYTGGGSVFDKAAAMSGSTPVSGLGDRAVYVPNVGGIFIADGTSAVQVQVVKAGVPGSKQDCVTIAEYVMAHRG